MYNIEHELNAYSAQWAWKGQLYLSTNPTGSLEIVGKRIYKLSDITIALIKSITKDFNNPTYLYSF